jgi:hypothetical protein
MLMKRSCPRPNSTLTPTSRSDGARRRSAPDIARGDFGPVGNFQTVSGEALDINLSANVAVGGELTYVEV